MCYQCLLGVCKQNPSNSAAATSEASRALVHEDTDECKDAPFTPEEEKIIDDNLRKLEEMLAQ